MQPSLHFCLVMQVQAALILIQLRRSGHVKQQTSADASRWDNGATIFPACATRIPCSRNLIFPVPMLKEVVRSLVILHAFRRIKMRPGGENATTSLFFPC
jgi:hypothetical protein